MINSIKIVPRQLKILDFDLENRPLSYLSSDWTSAEITAIGWSWIGSGPEEVDVLLLLPDGRFETTDGKKVSAETALTIFKSELDSADIVTGHYIRKHDLPILNSAMLEYGLPRLNSVLTQDTQQDLIKRKDLSASQENLAAMLNLPEPKHHMSQTEWRTANRLSREGIDATRKRVVMDVIQHMAVRAELLNKGWLRPPKMWNP